MVISNFGKVDVIYEDDDILGIVKPHGLHSVEDRTGVQTETVRSLMSAYHRSSMMVHRLDAGTGGLMVLAKNPTAHRRLNAQFEKSTVEKVYTALTCGLPKAQTLMLPIASKAAHGKFKINFRSGKPARTSFIPVEKLANIGIVKAIPHTGRTHQIRVHLKALKTPLYQDWVYNIDTTPDRRISLFASELRLLHPTTGEWISLSSELSDYMKSLINTMS